jgi:hypothetical protein
MKDRRLVSCMVRTIAATLILNALCAAQSIDPKRPTPLKEGDNEAVISSEVQVPHYYSFNCEPGQALITIDYSSNGFPGTGGAIGVNLYKDAKSPKNRITVSANQSLYAQNSPKPGQNAFSFRCEAKVKLTVRVEPPNSALLVAVGRYNIRATGSVSFDAPDPGAAPAVLATYRYGNDYVKLVADSRLESASGFSGNWKQFDEVSRTYVFTLPDSKRTLLYWPGVGFADETTRALVLKLAR